MHLMTKDSIDGGGSFTGIIIRLKDINATIKVFTKGRVFTKTETTYKLIPYRSCKPIHAIQRIDCFFFSFVSKSRYKTIPLVSLGSFRSHQEYLAISPLAIALVLYFQFPFKSIFN